MTDLLHILPDFPTNGYTHLIPSLEKNFVTTTDLLTLDAVEIAKRARLPVLDLRRLANHIISLLHGQLGLEAHISSGSGPEDAHAEGSKTEATLPKRGQDLSHRWQTISTLDSTVDDALGGGIPTRYITEITGESGTGKTQLLLTLLLSAQLPPPYGLSRPTLYISTEHPLPTTRLSQILRTHPLLSGPSSNPASARPSLSRILTYPLPDLETQDHILTYQLPVALQRHNIGLVVIDSIAANYRAETSSATTIAANHKDSTRNHATLTGPAALASRSADLVRLGQHLRKLARDFNCAVVVANQVADRFGAIPLARAFSQEPGSSPHAGLVPPSSISTSGAVGPVVGDVDADRRLTLDHQQRFFTGWGDTPPGGYEMGEKNLKSPALGLVWANQIACRIALVREGSWARSLPSGVGKEVDGDLVMGGAEWAPRKWRRWMRVVFAPWVRGVEAGERGVEFEVWAGGVRSLGVEERGAKIQHLDDVTN